MAELLAPIPRKLAELGVAGGDVLVDVLSELLCLKNGPLCKRPWQGKAVRKILSNVLNKRNTILNAPTGSGKTLVAILSGLLLQLHSGTIIEVNGRKLFKVPAVVYIVGFSEHAARYIEDYWKRIVFEVANRCVGKNCRGLIDLLAELSPVPYNSTVYTCPIEAAMKNVGLDIDIGANCEVRRTVKHRVQFDVDGVLKLGGALLVSGASPTVRGLYRSRWFEELVRDFSELDIPIPTSDLVMSMPGAARIYMAMMGLGACPVVLVRRPFPTRILPFASIQPKLEFTALGFEVNHAGHEVVLRYVVREKGVCGGEDEHEIVDEDIDEEVDECNYEATVEAVANQLGTRYVVPDFVCSACFGGDALEVKLNAAFYVIDEAHRLVEYMRYSSSQDLGIYPSLVVRASKVAGRLDENFGREVARMFLEAFSHMARLIKGLSDEVYNYRMKVCNGDTFSNVKVELDLAPLTRFLVEITARVVPLLERNATELGVKLLRYLRDVENIPSKLDIIDIEDVRGLVVEKVWKVVARAAGVLRMATRQVEDRKTSTVIGAARDSMEVASVSMYALAQLLALLFTVLPSHCDAKSDILVHRDEKVGEVVFWIDKPKVGKVLRFLVSEDDKRIVQEVSKTYGIDLTDIDVVFFKLSYATWPRDIPTPALLMSGSIPKFVEKLLTGESEYVYATELGARRGRIVMNVHNNFITLDKIRTSPEKFAGMVLASVGKVGTSVVAMTSNDYNAITEWARKCIDEARKKGSCHGLYIAERWLEKFPSLVTNNVKLLERLLFEKGVAAISLFGTLSESMEVVVNGASMIRGVVVLRVTPGSEDHVSSLIGAQMAKKLGVDFEDLRIVNALIRVAQVLGRSVRSEHERAVAEILDGSKLRKMVNRLGLDLLRQLGFTDLRSSL